MARLLLAAALVLAACGDDRPSARQERVDQARTAAAEAGLPDDVADLLGDAAGGVEATYRVAYDVDDRTVVVTQRPPDRRVDVTGADGVVDSTITVDGRSTACTDPPGDAAVVCDELGAAEPAGVLDADALATFVDAVGAAVDDHDFAVEDRTVAGTDARCLVTTRRSTGDRATLCIAATGALLLVERPAGTLRATAYDPAVDDDAFALPDAAS